MRIARSLLAPLLLWGLALALHAEPAAVIAPSDVWRDYRMLLGQRDPLTLTQFRGMGTRRDVVELVLVQQALRLGGWREGIRPVEATAYSRILREIADGRALVSGTTAWRADLAPLGAEVYISRALIGPGQSVAGFYTVPGNVRALAARNLDEVRQLRAVSNRQWRADWEVLSRLGLQELYDVAAWPSMVAMLAAGRADVVLAPFQPGNTMQFKTGGVTLVPVPNIKVSLPGSRHFAVSLLAPQGHEAAQALDRGLALLQQRGVIRRAYEQAGFINPRVAGWTTLN